MKISIFYFYIFYIPLKPYKHGENQGWQQENQGWWFHRIAKFTISKIEMAKKEELNY